MKVTRKHIREYVAKYKNTPNGYYAFLKKNAKQGCYEFLITRDEFVEWYKNQIKRCTYCGIPEEKISLLKTPKGNVSRKLGIDRINSSLGYKIGNICICCITCNRVKTDVFTYDEMLFIGELIYKKWKLQEKMRS